MTIAFGTEGWRAIMAEEFTAENVRRVTQAIADHLRVSASRSGEPAPRVIVGHDTRFLSDYFAKAVCEILAGNRIRSLLTDRAIPTCAVSRAVVARRLSAGIMVTASHNPAIYNGLKVKEAYGGSATTQTVASIERRLGRGRMKRVPLAQAYQEGLVRTVNVMPEFLRGLRSFIDLALIRRSSLRVIIDSMHGAGGRLLETLLTPGRCRIETLHAAPDPLFGGHAPEPIAAHLGQLMRTVRRRRADVGIANDGDADRLGVIGPGGRWLNPGQVMCVLLIHLAKSRKFTGAVVKTVSNTMMINRVTEALGLRLLEVPVGFKHVAKLMLEDDILIGGEESGGIGIKGYLPERDGLLNGLLVLEAIAARRQSLAVILQELERRYGRWWYARQDLHLHPAQVDRLFRRLRTAAPDQLAGVAVACVNTLDGVKLIGRDDSWLLFRRSGTEPIVRIYAETPTQRRLPQVLRDGVRLAHAS